MGASAEVPEPQGIALVLAALAALPGLQPFASQANMILLRVQGEPGAAARLYDALKKRQILVKNVSTMHPLLANCLRVVDRVALRGQGRRRFGHRGACRCMLDLDPMRSERLAVDRHA